MYGLQIGFAMAGETPYANFREGAGIYSYDGIEVVMTLDRATGQWSLPGGMAPAYACGDLSFNAVAASEDKVCAAFVAYIGDECDLAVMCMSL